MRKQLKLKEQLVADCFKKIAGLEVNVKPTIASDKIFEYRNKLQYLFPFALLEKL